MTEAMPFLQKYDITFLRPPTIPEGVFCCQKRMLLGKEIAPESQRLSGASSLYLTICRVRLTRPARAASRSPRRGSS